MLPFDAPHVHASHPRVLFESVVCLGSWISFFDFGWEAAVSPESSVSVVILSTAILREVFSRRRESGLDAEPHPPVRGRVV